MVGPQGLRSHDVCVLLQLTLRPDLTFRELASGVGLSLGEAHNSRKRLEAAGLVQPGGARTNVTGSLEFLGAGVPYVFPGLLGPETRGVPTAFSAPPLSDQIQAEETVVWPSAEGTVRGLSLQPLCAGAPGTKGSNPALYRLLTLVDGIRIGRARERRLATEHLERLMRAEPERPCLTD